MDELDELDDLDGHIGRDHDIQHLLTAKFIYNLCQGSGHWLGVQVKQGISVSEP